jgi:hypothetical protein
VVSTGTRKAAFSHALVQGLHDWTQSTGRSSGGGGGGGGGGGRGRRGVTGCTQEQLRPSALAHTLTLWFSW